MTAQNIELRRLIVALSMGLILGLGGIARMAQLPPPQEHSLRNAPQRDQRLAKLERTKTELPLGAAGHTDQRPSPCADAGDRASEL
jgi:hypothetical protein